MKKNIFCKNSLTYLIKILEKNIQKKLRKEELICFACEVCSAKVTPRFSVIEQNCEVLQKTFNNSLQSYHY